MTKPPRLVPELEVTSLAEALRFYVGLAGFRLAYGRPEEGFAYLDRDGVHLMLEEAEGPGRRFHAAPLQRPFGRGVNFQIEVDDVGKLWERMRDAAPITLPFEERWYRRETEELGHHQFVVADPDGYLLRFFTSLGTRPAVS
ncbi:bleomycin resistance protein [Kaistia nematophila]|uniref:Bleomycin resistance protein n=1 Tax=Kaistia nematophila TaxID=2994654 RepID=A0A9X3E2V2_9HYPH|nr:VOC family protein [Kaistia nematophila]MCX5570731.1 VOC family protein [Kaistia nematophila]